MWCLSTRWRHSCLIKFDPLSFLISILSQPSVPTACVARAGSLKSGTAAVLRRVSPKVKPCTQNHLSNKTTQQPLMGFLTLCVVWFVAFPREILLRGDLPRPGSVPCRMVLQPGCAGSRYTLRCPFPALTDHGRVV